MFNILNQTLMLEDSCFTAVYQLKRLPQQSLNTRQPTLYAALSTEKLNLLNKQCFYWNNVQCQKLQQVFEVQSFGFDTGPQSFATRLLPCRQHVVRRQPKNSLFGCVKSPPTAGSI